MKLTGCRDEGWRVLLSHDSLFNTFIAFVSSRDCRRGNGYAHVRTTEQMVEGYFEVVLDVR